MMVQICSSSLLMATMFLGLASAVDQVADPALNVRMKQATTHLEQQALLTDADYVYDFSRNPKSTFKPGGVANANAATWPLLTTTGMTVAQLNLGPCAMLPPHLHRATNLVVAVNGTTHTYMIQENGARLVETYLSPGKMTIFPAASLHSMVNEGCGNNVLYSFLNSEDPGTLNVANAFWSLGSDIGNRIMPMINVNAADWNATGARIPEIGTGSNSGMAACLKKCNIQG